MFCKLCMTQAESWDVGSQCTSLYWSKPEKWNLTKIVCLQWHKSGQNYRECSVGSRAWLGARARKRGGDCKDSQNWIFHIFWQILSSISDKIWETICICVTHTKFWFRGTCPTPSQSDLHPCIRLHFLVTWMMNFSTMLPNPNTSLCRAFFGFWQ